MQLKIQFYYDNNICSKQELEDNTILDRIIYIRKENVDSLILFPP